MKTVFADTLYWTAMARPNDPWADQAKAAKSALGQVMLVTTDEVLGEFLNLLSGKGPHLRMTAVKMVNAILSNPNVEVLPQTRDGFRAGLKRYADRPDKEYSLPDCISMNVMDDEGITDVLTNDHHFEQEGFLILIR